LVEFLYAPEQKSLPDPKHAQSGAAQRRSYFGFVERKGGTIHTRVIVFYRERRACQPEGFLMNRCCTILYIVVVLAGVLRVTNSTRADDPPKDTWVYHQSTGELSLNGKVVATGYSGHDKGMNNADSEGEKNVGPIPRGEWSIGEAFKHETKGPVVMKLTPVGHDARGRSGFLIHGDNSKMDRSASEGCIILERAARDKIAESGFKKLLVVK
jgi:hypothetical protein